MSPEDMDREIVRLVNESEAAWANQQFAKAVSIDDQIAELQEKVAIERLAEWEADNE